MRLHCHGDCTGTVRESALQVDSEGVGVREIPWGGERVDPMPHPDSNPRQYCAWLFSRTLYQLSLSPLSPVVFRAVVLPVKCFSILILMGHVGSAQF